MKPKYNITIVASALVLLLSNAVFAEVNLLTATDSRKEVTVGTYDPVSSGNQTRIREWDGRDFTALGIESFSTYGYNLGTQYWFDARDLTLGDESIYFGVASRNTLTFRGGTNMLTHRLIRTPVINPWIALQRAGLTTPAAVTIGTSWDSLLDLSPNAQFSTEDRFTNLDLNWNVDANQRFGLVTGWWQESQHGQQQLLFRAREAKAGVIANRTRGSVAWPIDRETNEGTIGGDVAIGSNSVVNLRWTDIKFGDNRPDIAPRSRLDFLPLNATTRVKSETQSRIIKARTNITDNLQFTGVQINRERTSNGYIPAGYSAAGTFMSRITNLDSTNLSLNYRATDSLSFTGRWRQFDNDDNVPQILSASSTVTSNLQSSRNIHSLDIESIYTGVNRTYLRFGYENRQSDRTNNNFDPGETEVALPFTSASTDTNIWRAALRYHPIMPLNISGNYETSHSDTSEFTGSPNNRTKTNLNATYMICDNAAIYGDFSKLDENNSEIREAGVIPDTAVDTAGQDARELAAGQGLKNAFTTTSIGTWLAVNDRLTLDVNYGAVETSSSTLWIVGFESAFPPHLPAQVVPYNANDTQWSAGANYLLSKKVKLNAGFLHSTSNGSSLVDPKKFAGLGPEWTPFKVKQDRWTVGVRYGISSNDSLDLDYSYGKWTDEVDAAQTGQFQLYRLAWKRSY